MNNKVGIERRDTFITGGFTTEFQKDSLVVNPPVIEVSRRSIIFCSKMPRDLIFIEDAGCR